MPDPATHEGPGAPVTLVPVNGTTLPGHLVLPPSPIGLALIARLEHGGPASEAYGAIGLRASRAQITRRRGVRMERLLLRGRTRREGPQGA